MILGKIKTSIVQVIVRDYWRANVLAITLPKFISLVVQILLAGLVIANYFENKLGLTAKENHVALHELDEWNSKTDCRIFAYK